MWSLVGLYKKKKKIIKTKVLYYVRKHTFAHFSNSCRFKTVLYVVSYNILQDGWVLSHTVNDLNWLYSRVKPLQQPSLVYTCFRPSQVYQFKDCGYPYISTSLQVHHLPISVSYTHLDVYKRQVFKDMSDQWIL